MRRLLSHAVGEGMPGAESISTWGTLVLMLPFGLLLALAVFGADERLAAPKRRSLRVRFCEMGADGQPEIADPDGAVWRLDQDNGRLEARGVTARVRQGQT
jgi:hypothetical protein